MIANLAWFLIMARRRVELSFAGRGFRQFVGCTWQVFLCFPGEKMLSSTASSHFENSPITSWLA